MPKQHERQMKEIVFSVENSFSLENEKHRYNKDGDNTCFPLPSLRLAVMMM
jgi:hypothetical protein